MSTTPIIVLTGPPAAAPALAYATRLAHTMGVPLDLRAQPGGPGPEALLLVVARPAASPATPAGLPGLVRQLLQTATQPVLLVPDPCAGQVPPLRIALAADGEPFALLHGQRAMHALLLTLPIQLTVVHALAPGRPFSGTDARQTVLACGLATRYLAAGLREVPGPDVVAGILQGVQQAQADLLVVIVRQRSLRGPHFGHSTTAALLSQSPVPVLLLLAAEG